MANEEKKLEEKNAENVELEKKENKDIKVDENKNNKVEENKDLKNKDDKIEDKNAKNKDDKVEDKKAKNKDEKIDEKKKDNKEEDKLKKSKQADKSKNNDAKNAKKNKLSIDVKLDGPKSNIELKPKEYKYASLKEIAEQLKNQDNIVICGHTRPDGDCIGSQVALAEILKQLKKNVVCLIPDEDKVPANLLFLHGACDFVNTQRFKATDFFELKDSEKPKKRGFFARLFGLKKEDPAPKYAFVAVDVQPEHRLGDAGKSIKKDAEVAIVIDHHKKEILNADYVFVDDTAAANSINIWQLAKEFGIKFDKKIALPAFTGLVSDTNSFRNSNTDSRCFDFAKEMLQYDVNPAFVAKKLFHSRSLKSYELEKSVLNNMIVDKESGFVLSYLSCDDYSKNQATKADSDALIDILRELECIDVACLLRQESKDAKIRGSIRSKTDMDVSKLAKKYNGGGHKGAAGFTTDETDINKAIEDVKANLKKLHDNKL